MLKKAGKTTEDNVKTISMHGRLLIKGMNAVTISGITYIM